MLRFNDIADRVLDYNPGTDLELLQKAYVYSAKVHDGQERLSGEPYLIHPLEVAGILVDMRVDDVTVAVGLLHDTLEDTLTTREELEEVFGEQVVFLVEGLTKIAKIEFTSLRERQAENFRKMLVAMSKDIRILLVKLADRLHNMRTLGFMKEDSRLRIAQETLDIYVPLAHRLGIHWMKQELEDLAFRALHPERAVELEAVIEEMVHEREGYVDEVIGMLSARLVDAGIEAQVTGRLKDIASIDTKMQQQGVGIEQIYDVVAFRIVTGGQAAECYAALGVVHGSFAPVPTRFKDYVALPKRNGYQSLHTTVIGPYGERMEIQIRTEEMHRAAELGIAAHWKYKAGRFDDDGDTEKFAWLRQLLEWQREVADPHEFLETVKFDLFPDEVFVFTPQGDVMNLPRDATPVDFAYAIHSEVGDHCAGARVNAKQVPLRHKLMDGDTVEIQTSRHQFPRKDWLEFVASGKARNRIRHAIRAAGKQRAQQLGRDLLERELRRAGLSLGRLIEDGRVAEFAEREVKGGQVEDLFAALSYGKLSATQVVRGLAPEAASEVERPAVSAQERLRSLFRRPRSQTTPGIRVGGMSDVMVRFAGCCDPLPGEDVTGFVTRGRGVTVHAKECPKVFELDPERRLEVQWEEESPVARPIRVKVRSRDEPGILAKITKSISSAGVNIGSASVASDSGRAVQSFELWVTDAELLKQVMKDIARVKGVISVDRVRG